MVQAWSISWRKYKYSETMCSPSAVFFTKPYHAKTQTHRSGLIQSVKHNRVLRGNAFPSGWFALWIPTGARYIQKDSIDWVMCSSIISQSRCNLILSIFYMNPHPTNIRTYGSWLIQLLTQMHVFRGNAFPGGWFSSRIYTQGRSRQMDKVVSHCA